MTDTPDKVPDADGNIWVTKHIANPHGGWQEVQVPVFVGPIRPVNLSVRTIPDSRLPQQIRVQVEIETSPVKQEVLTEVVPKGSLSFLDRMTDAQRADLKRRMRRSR